MRVAKLHMPPQTITQSDMRDYLIAIREVINQSGDAITNVNIVTTETATGAYGPNEQLMLNHLRIDVSTIAVKINALLAELRTLKVLNT